jgi:hypothetical protein
MSFNRKLSTAGGLSLRTLAKNRRHPRSQVFSLPLGRVRPINVTAARRAVADSSRPIRPCPPGEQGGNGMGEKPGTIIGRYKLLEPIGEGGFGVVYVAEQQRTGPSPCRPQDHQAGHGHPGGHRPLRGRAPGPGPHGSPEHRQGPRRAARRTLTRPPAIPLPSDGRGAGGEGTRHIPAGSGRSSSWNWSGASRSPSTAIRRNGSRSGTGSNSSSRSVTPSNTRTRKGSFTATSNPRTSWSPSHDGLPHAEGDRFRRCQGDPQAELTELTLLHPAPPIHRHSRLHEPRTGGDERAGR